MITGTHAIIYSEDPDRARAFFRDVLDLPFVDAHEGWLIYKLPPAELGIHPTSGESAPSGHHELYLMCDDLTQTMADLESKGAQFTGEIQNPGFGLLATLQVPGGGNIGLYQPRHTTAHDL